MEFSENLQIGDKVVFKVDRERRAWTDTYKDIPDGTVGVVCGFYDAVRSWGRESAYIKKPGTYWSKGAASVRLDDGRIITGCGNEIELVDQDEKQRRDAQNRDDRGVFVHPEVFLGDLPPTDFWEGDKVEMIDGDKVEVVVVQSITYHNIHNQEYPNIYTVRHPDKGWQMGAKSSDLKLVERGNIWKEEHGEPLSFSSLQEEAGFARMRGRAEEIRNPRTDNYAWTLEEALAAIKAGDAHAFSNGMVPFSNTRMISVHRFKDEDLGRRLAAETLAGFADKVA